MTHPNVARRVSLWLMPYRLLKEPRVVSAIFAFIYLGAAFGIGLPTVVDVPDTILAGPVDLSLAWAVGVLAILGGVSAAASLWGGAWFLERMGILFVMGACLARAVIVLTLPIPDAQTVVRVTELGLIVLFLTVRLRQVSGLALDPLKGGRVK